MDDAHLSLFVTIGRALLIRDRAPASLGAFDRAGVVAGLATGTREHSARVSVRLLCGQRWSAERERETRRYAQEDEGQTHAFVHCCPHVQLHLVSQVTLHCENKYGAQLDGVAHLHPSGFCACSRVWTRARENPTAAPTRIVATESRRIQLSSSRQKAWVSLGFGDGATAFAALWARSLANVGPRPAGRRRVALVVGRSIERSRRLRLKSCEN